MKTILITGASGGVGTFLRRELAGAYRLRLSDIRPIDDLDPNERFVGGDIADLKDMLRVTRGVDAIVHLGGFSVEGPWDDILSANIIGCYNAYEAARRNGVRRLIFATSNHAVGFYRRDEVIDHTVYPRPDGRYGVSKVFGEMLGRLYADKYQLQTLCIRIGNVGPRPIDKRRLSLWLSPRDLAQLVKIGIEHPDIVFEIVYGISGNTRAWYDNRNAVRLGYRPQDDSEVYAAEILDKHVPGDPRAEMYQGGAFVHEERIDNPAPLSRKRAVKSSGKRPATRKTAAKPAKPPARKAAAKKSAARRSRLR